MTFNDLDAKMRVYEQSLDQIIPPENYLLARIDGRGFTRLTKEICQFEAPFDERFNRMMVETVKALVADYFRWRMEDAHRNCLNSWCYWTLCKEGLSASKASKELEGKSIAFKNELLIQRGINFINDLPIWQRRGVGVYWREYQKMGHNPITGEDRHTTRREVFADYNLPKGFVPQQPL